MGTGKMITSQHGLTKGMQMYSPNYKLLTPFARLLKPQIEQYVWPAIRDKEVPPDAEVGWKANPAIAIERCLEQPNLLTFYGDATAHELEHMYRALDVNDRSVVVNILLRTLGVRLI